MRSYKNNDFCCSVQADWGRVRLSFHQLSAGEGSFAFLPLIFCLSLLDLGTFYITYCSGSAFAATLHACSIPSSAS